MVIDEKRLRHRLERAQELKAELEKLHKGKEDKFTYHGGFSLGYVKGKIHEIEELLSEIEESKTESIRDRLFRKCNMDDPTFTREEFDECLEIVLHQHSKKLQIDEYNKKRNDGNK